MKNFKFLNVFILIAAMLFWACDTGGDSTGNGDDNPTAHALVGFWELDTMTEGSDTPMDFPIDYTVMMGGADIDSDGTDEVLTYSMIVEMTQTTARMYGKVTLVDEGSSTIAAMLSGAGQTPADIGLPFLENGVKYNPDGDSTITVTDTEIQGIGDGTNAASYTLSGTTLTITDVDDQGTADTSDDVTMVMVFQEVDSSAVAGAVADATLNLFEQIKLNAKCKLGHILAGLFFCSKKSKFATRNKYHKKLFFNDFLK